MTTVQRLIDLTLLSCYGLCLVGLLAYSLSQLHLAWASRRPPGPVPRAPPDARSPRVTVQLPIFNERYVVERLLSHVASLDHPRELLEIQVLDDSTDETPRIVAGALARLEAEGIRVAHLQRSRRDGFKAGALAHGLAQASGEFVAIFDADFCPAPDFLRRALPWFQDPRVGAVQLRWDFLNEGYSLLTRVQAFLLRLHFDVEQPGRDARRLFANFNGSGGVWRRAAIEDAGGWRADTLTEDIDLSYRSQMRGWRIVYLALDGCPSELPVEVGGFRSQQFRWIKGGAENARRHVPAVLRSRLPWLVKLHALAHLLAGSAYVLTLGVVLCSVAFALEGPAPLRAQYAGFGSPFLLATLSLLVVLHQAQGARGRGLWGLLWFLPMVLAFMALTMGLSAHNALATVRGWLGQRSEFVRTPKYGIVGSERDWSRKGYSGDGRRRFATVEIVFAAAVIAGLAAGSARRDFSAFPILCMTLAGLAWIGGLSVWHAALTRRHPAAGPTAAAQCAIRHARSQGSK